MNQGKPPGSKSTAFDGEEPTEVMPLRAPATPSPEPEPEVEEDNPDKQYVAPLVLPAARVPEKDTEGAKIVLNIPEPLANRTVADERARRRAPTVKISRAEVLGEAKKKPSEELTMPGINVRKQAAHAQMDATVDDPNILKEIQGRKNAGYIAPATPISDAPPRPSDHPASGRALEPPATSMPVGLTPVRQEKSKAPWLVFGILALGAAGAGVVAVTQGNKPTAEDAPTIKLPSTAGAATAAASLRLEPPPPALPPVTATATETAVVASNVEDLPTATATAEDPPTKPTDAAVAVAPTAPPSPRPPRTASTAKPTATARPTVVKTSDIPSGI